MKLELPILLTTLSLVFLSYDAHAGTSFTGLSGKVTVLDLAEEKRKSDTQQDKSSSSITEQLDSIRQRVVKNEDSDMDINRLIADLIFLEVNEKQEHTQLIMELQRMKTKPVGATVITGSTTITTGE